MTTVEIQITEFSSGFCDTNAFIHQEDGSAVMLQLASNESFAVAECHLHARGNALVEFVNAAGGDVRHTRYRAAAKLGQR